LIGSSTGAGTRAEKEKVIEINYNSCALTRGRSASRSADRAALLKWTAVRKVDAPRRRTKIEFGWHLCSATGKPRHSDASVAP